MHQNLGFEAGHVLARGLNYDEAEDIYSSVLREADEAYDHFK